MNSRTRKLSLTVVSVIAVLCILLSQALMLPQKAANAAGTDLYVGYSGQSNNFSTVQDAVNKAASLDPQSENDRVTIHIAPGIYRQQVVVQSPYITFVNDDPSKEVKLTWYYGIGYKYYSANSKGYYDASAAASKSAKNIANYRWGATVQLWPKASYFKAKNIVFENSFNRYLTQEELADGVECTNETLTVQRYSGADVQSKAYTERAAALSADASYCEFLNCTFLSSQDTLYTGKTPQYYKNCRIEGQTDYIFGDGSVVFDTCDLVWKGYSSGTTGGYITAARDEGDNDTGYLFWNCTVKKGSLPVSTGYLGRPWRDSAKVMFVNTVLESGDLINAQGWTSMSGVQPETVAGFKEYGTKVANGGYVDLSQRKGHVLSENDVKGITLTSYMKNWTPVYLNGSGDSQGTDIPSADSAITSCGGWYEEAFAEWDSSKIGSNVKVSYAPAGGESVPVDPQLIRGNRVDIPGLKGNSEYTIKVEGSSASAVCTVKTMSFDRSGYAHWKYSSGVGAYNNDGTLKSGVEVIYVTNSNKDSITYGGKTGLYNIFYSAKPKNVVFRFIGKIGVPAGAKANDGQQNDGSSMLYLQNAENVTIEGIGYDAALDKWGFEMKRSTSCEVRNIWLGQYPDDGISMSGSSDNKSTHMWIHNCTIEKGYNAFAGNGIVDDDKADGDGSLDIKWSDYITISYNEFKDGHKTSLVGGGTNHLQDWITYHHNWFNGTESRNPRARNAHIHSYNNYFCNNKQYGIGASYNSKVFSEANFFENTYLPLDAVAMGSDAYSGTIKSYADKFSGCDMGSGLAYVIANSRTDYLFIANQKSGGDAYDNFDTDSTKIYSSYSVQSADDAKTEVKTYAGVMQNKSYNAGSIGGTVIEPVKPIDGEIVKNLVILDSSNAGAWGLSQNVKTGDKAFGDRDFTLDSIPQSIVGAEQIITACNSKNTDSDLAEFTVGADSVVYVAQDSRVENTPSWLGAYRRTGDSVIINDTTDARTFNVFAMDVSAGDKVVLGTNGMSGACMHYVAFVKERAVVTTTTTTTTVTTTTTTTATVTTTTATVPSVTVWGDANGDGIISTADAAAILQYLGNKEKFPLSQQGERNADVFNNGDGITPKDALTIQQAMAGLIDKDSLPVK